jgi:hypothetical protein
MSKKLFAACLVIAAFAVVPSLASANPILTQPTGTAMGTGVGITATNVGETLLETPTGTLRCTTAILTGTVTSNTTATGAKGEITDAKFGGTGGLVAGADEPECTGSNFFTPNTTITPKSSLPWCLEAPAAADTFTLKGGKCGSQKEITFALDVTGIANPCTYSRAATINGTIVTHGAGANENTMAVTNVQFLREAGVSEICPSEGKLTMRFSLKTTTGSNPIFLSS